MKKIIGIISGLFITTLSFAQVNLKQYFDLVKQADSLYEEKDFRGAAIKQTKALNLLGQKASFFHRSAVVNYFTLAKELDSAFDRLQQLSYSSDLTYKNIDFLLLDDELPPLRADPRWKPTLNQIYISAYKKYLAKYGFTVNAIDKLTKDQKDFALAVANHSDNAFIHLNDRAYLLLKQKKYYKAYELFKFSIDFFSPNPILYKNMVDYYIAIHDLDRAYVYFSKAEVVKYKQGLPCRIHY